MTSLDGWTGSSNSTPFERPVQDVALMIDVAYSGCMRPNFTNAL